MGRNAKPVISYSSGKPINCTWHAMHGEERTGYELYKLVVHEHARTIPCDLGKHVNYVFCSERCRQYFRNSHTDNLNLPGGFKSSI